MTPALSELAHLNAFQPQPQDKLSREGLQMSLVALGRHYIRDGTGSEQLYDLNRDPSELVNLMDSVEGKQEVGVFRRMLLGVLTDNPGSIEVENAYLKPYKAWLKSLVQADSPTSAPILVRIRDNSRWPNQSWCLQAVPEPERCETLRDRRTGIRLFTNSSSKTTGNLLTKNWIFVAKKWLASPLAGTHDEYVLTSRRTLTFSHQGSPLIPCMWAWTRAFGLAHPLLEWQSIAESARTPMV